MRMNKKGDIGFLEAIMAVMLVTIALSAYLGIFVLNATEDAYEPEKIDRDIVNTLCIEDNRIEGDLIPELERIIEQKGYRGITVRCYVPGDLAITEEFHSGSMEGHISGERFLKNLYATGNRKIPVIFEVAICS